MNVSDRKTVVFLPFLEANPYQSELIGSLSDLGCNVIKERKFRILSNKFFAISTLHLHWLPSFSKSFVGCLKLCLFVFRVFTCRLLGKRVVWTVHNLYSHDSKSKNHEKILILCISMLCNKIIVHSPKAMDMFCAEFSRFFRKKMSIVYHGNYQNAYENKVSRLVARERLGVPSEDTVYLFLGNIRPYKGVENLVEAFKKSGIQNATMIIAGKPKDEDINKKISDLVAGDEKIIYRPGFVEDNEIQYYFAASDASVFPYCDVLTSGAVVLGMSFSNVCVAPKIGCIPDYLDDAHNILYDADDKEGLVSALVRVDRNKEKLMEMGKLNYIKSSEWSWNQVANKTLSLY